MSQEFTCLEHSNEKKIILDLLTGNSHKIDVLNYTIDYVVK